MWTISLSAQELSEIDLTHHCIYDSHQFEETLYPSIDNQDILEMVAEICEASDIELDFKVIAANVPSIAAVVDGENRYLLYSNVFVRFLKYKKPLLYFILAHEIGHLVLSHDLNDRFRMNEEMSADEFAGRAMYRLYDDLPVLLDFIKDEKYAYDTLNPFTERLINIKTGWEISDLLIQSAGNLGFLENKMEDGDLPLPRYNPTGCPKSYVISLDSFSDCKTLKDIDSIISKALDKQGYEQKSYYATENGFALFAPIEQIDKNGKCLEGNARWQDFPARNNFEGILDYFKSLLLPNPGYFRIFIFVVNDQNIIAEKSKMTPEEMKGWLQNGGQWLPDVIGNKILNDSYHVTAQVYEFEAPESTKLMTERCENNLLQPKSHLEKSGVLGALNE